MYRQINNFVKIEFIMVLSVEEVTYIYRPIDGFAKVEFVEVF
jgi:hypothetical protein